jgi:Spy/CpxP family protein refolding chaperone
MLKETTMKRTVKIALAVVGVLSLALAGSVALAQHGHEGFMQRRMARHIDQALDAVNATDAQRNAVHAARDHVTATFQENAASRQADMQEALTLWQSDRIDPAALAALRARHQAAAKKVGDAIVQAISDAHDALTAPQRQQLIAYAKSHRPPKMEGAKPWMQHMVSERVDDMLDQIKATTAQRDTTHAAVQSVFAAFAGEDPTSHFDTALALFAADKIDAGKVAALQAEHQAHAQKMGDAIVDAITKVHDALSPAQRAQVAELVKQHHHEHHGG